MRKIAFVVGVVGAAVVLIRRLQGGGQAQTPPPVIHKEKQRVEIPFDDLSEKPVAQTADDDLPLSPTPIIVGNHVDETPPVLAEPLMSLAEMPVEDTHANPIIEPAIDPNVEEDAPPLVTASVEDLPLEEVSPYVVVPEVTENLYDEPIELTDTVEEEVDGTLIPFGAEPVEDAVTSFSEALGDESLSVEIIEDDEDEDFLSQAFGNVSEESVEDETDMPVELSDYDEEEDFDVPSDAIPNTQDEAIANEFLTQQFESQNLQDELVDDEEADELDASEMPVELSDYDEEDELDFLSETPAEIAENEDDDFLAETSIDEEPDFDALEFGDTPPMEFLKTGKTIPDVMVDDEKQKWPGDVLAKEVFSGQVTQYHSADTFQITRADTGASVQFRLWGINASRNDAPFGPEALAFSQEFIEGKTLSFEVRASFRDGQRLVGWLIADGESLNVALLENGLARWYSEVFPDETLLADVEARARAERRGFWGAE